MNVIFILGNGFDLQLGLKTRYEHFYEYYKRQPSPNKLVADVKNQINNYLNGKESELPSVNWADLELALGQYTKVLGSYSDFRTVFLDINMELMKYLKRQEQMFPKDNVVLAKLRDDFSKPENYLSTNQKRQYIKLIDGNTGLFILTLNYTHIPRIVFEKQAPPYNSNNNTTNLSEIVHIHGDLDMQNVFLGVNDESQIANEDLRNDAFCKRMLVKPLANNMIDDQRVGHMRNIINNAKVIVIYGASLGDSDLMWRDVLKNKMESLNTYFLIVEYRDGFDNLWDQTVEEDNARMAFIKKLGLEDTATYQSYVFVAVTKKMFCISDVKNNV